MNISHRIQSMALPCTTKGALPKGVVKRLAELGQQATHMQGRNNGW